MTALTLKQCLFLAKKLPWEQAREQHELYNLFRTTQGLEIRSYRVVGIVDDVLFEAEIEKTVTAEQYYFHLTANNMSVAYECPDTQYIARQLFKQFYNDVTARIQGRNAQKEERIMEKLKKI